MEELAIIGDEAVEMILLCGTSCPVAVAGEEELPIEGGESELSERGPAVCP